MKQTKLIPDDGHVYEELAPSVLHLLSLSLTILSLTIHKWTVNSFCISLRLDYHFVLEEILTITWVRNPAHWPPYFLQTNPLQL